jgi:hypothetical protein
MYQLGAMTENCLTKSTASCHPRELLSYSVKFLSIIILRSNIIQSSTVIWSSSNCRDSQADPSFVSVEQGAFTIVKLRSCICSFLKTQLCWTEIDCAVMSDPTFWQIPIYKYNGHPLQYFEVNMSSLNEFLCRR